MAPPRTFDYDEARRRYAAGESLSALAREFGVSYTAVCRAVNERVRRRMDAASTRYTKNNYREPCRGHCGRLVWMHGTQERTGYCQQCLGERTRVEQHGTETGYRQGCRRSCCIDAMTEAKRRRRERSRVPCSHGCGRLVDSINRGNPEKPFECRSCAAKRVQAERKAAA